MSDDKILKTMITVCKIFVFICIIDGRDSVVGIATPYGLDSPGIESSRGEIFRTRPDWPWGPPSLLYNGYRVISRGKVARTWRVPPAPLRQRG
jgi:hypothetical protein